MTKIGFVGLGIMGRPMARNLMKAGHEVVAYDIVPALVEKSVADGATAAASVGDVAAGVGVDHHHAARWAGGGSMPCSAAAACWRAPSPAPLVVDMSSISPMVSQKIGAACAAKGVRFPGCAGERRRAEGRRRHAGHHGGRQAGSLRPRRAGSQADGIERHAHRTGGRRQRHQAGQPDHGGVQHRRHGRGAGAGYPLRGSTRKWYFNAVKGGLAGSTVLNAKAPMVIDRNFKPGFRIKLHQKDLRNALLAAEAMKVALPADQPGAAG